MEKIIRRVFLIGCLLTGAAVSLTAASGYAVTTTGSAAASTGASMNTQFSLTVGPAYTLTKVEFVGNATAGDGTAYIQALAGGIAKGKLSATVQSNTGYQLQLSAENPALKDEKSSETIPAKTFADTTGTITASGWGVKNSTGNFTALTTTPTSFFSTTASAPAGTKTDLEVGVGVTKMQPAGNYSTTVTLTLVKQP